MHRRNYFTENRLNFPFSGNVFLMYLYIYNIFKLFKIAIVLLFVDWLNNKKEAERKIDPIPHSLSRVFLQKPEWHEKQPSGSGTSSAPA